MILLRMVTITKVITRIITTRQKRLRKRPLNRLITWDSQRRTRRCKIQDPMMIMILTSFRKTSSHNSNKAVITLIWIAANTISSIATNIAKEKMMKMKDSIRLVPTIRFLKLTPLTTWSLKLLRKRSKNVLPLK